METVATLGKGFDCNSVWICWCVPPFLLLFLRWSNKVCCAGVPPCLSIDHNQGPCSFIAVLFSYCPRNLQTPFCARCHKSYILTVFLPLCVFYLWVKAIKHAACTLCVHSCHLSRTLLWKWGEKKSKVSLFISLHKSLSLLKTDADRMRKHNKWRFFNVYVSRLFRWTLLLVIKAAVFSSV